MLDDIKKTLWATADKLRANMDAAEYKHLVLGLIFVKYISDTFAAHHATLMQRLADPNDEYFYGDADPADIAAELEDRDYYKEANVFWVPEGARWEALRNAAKQPDIGKRIDDALTLIEAENPKLKGILDKRYARAQLPDGKLGELVDLVSTIGFGDDAAQARDVLGQVYEYFLGQFASAEGKKGGQFYTPASIVKTLVAILSPHEGKVYDPCCGSGGMFVQSEKFIEAHGGKLGDVSIYGQESNPTTWRLAAMNLAIRGIDYNLGREPADTFTRNQHPDLRADYILANPPFNISDWWHGSLEGDPRWEYGDPPHGNANYAWLQHMLHHLKPTGRAGIVLANGSMSSSQNNEGVIRAAMVDADVVEVMVGLQGNRAAAPCPHQQPLGLVGRRAAPRFGYPLNRCPAMRSLALFHPAVLVTAGNSAWMLTGFQIRVPGGQKEGFDSKKPAQTATKPTRDGLGASTESIVADSSDDGNAVFSCLQSTVLVEICARNSLFSAQALFVSLLLDRQNAALDLYRALGSGRQAPTG
ncbi:type I restriction-modification system subunit M [Comamonas aquatica]|uniref:type I restriction-modification system subunit M n=2 Tax=Comamonadaceae TaxID=80864 RepID=UPI0024494F2D|nr:class I SAM-dependent DNA methyltransferase [Comamonas aquatica]MDH0371060.1 type I restriction-modification system subunit M [Comamonas aquatica]